MSVARLCVEPPLTACTEQELGADAARHARALRLQPGDVVELFDGTGGCYSASVVRVEKRQLTVRLGAHTPVERESPLVVTLVQGISKGDRMDWSVQKAVEFGVTRLLPVFTRHSVVRLQGERLRRRAEHWRGVVRSACEQCGRNTIPELLEPRGLEEAESALPAGQRLLLDPDDGVPLGRLPTPGADGVVLLVGPEGGLHPDELQWAREARFASLALGPRILRTESAAIGALAALQAYWGDLG